MAQASSETGNGMDERVTAEDDGSEVLNIARERYTEGVDGDDENRQAAADDLKFLAGEQWDSATKQEREEAGRPCLTINQMPKFLAQVEGDIRMNRPGIKVRPVENADDASADVFEGLIRSIEDGSDAQSAYASAGISAAACGMGHFRLVLEEPDDEAFDLEVRIRRIANPFAVVWDPVSLHPTKEDARYCFVTDKMSREEFEAKYGDVAADDYYSEHEPDDGWRDSDTVTVAEYWVRDRVKKVLVQVPDPVQGYQTLSLTKEEHEELVGAGIPVLKEREVMVPRVVSYVLTGNDVLEGPIEWPGKRIPIFPVFGRETHVGDRVVRAGVIRNAKDSQRLFNYMRSASAEMIALAPKAPVMVTAKMVAGREAEWDKSHTDNRPYLTYNADPQAPQGPQRQMPPPVQAALLQESALASEDMKATTGIYDAALGARSNETSGVAIRQRQMESDVGSYVFQDNLNRAVRACGAEMVRIIPKVYSGERQIRILGADMTPKIIAVNQQGGVDLGRGKHDVSISTGPGFSTRRQEAAQLFTDLISSSPQGLMLFGDIWAANLDVPGAEELKERLQMMMQAQQQPQEPGPSEQMDMAKSAADLEGKQLINAQRKFDLAQDVGQLQQVVQQTVLQTLAAMQGQAIQATPGMGAAPAPGWQPGR